MSFPPPKLPNIEVLLAIPSYDAPVLHDDLQLRLQTEISSTKKSQGKGILCLESSIEHQSLTRLLLCGGRDPGRSRLARILGNHIEDARIEYEGQSLLLD